MVSQVLPSPYFDPIFLIALIMLLFNLPPLLLSTLLLVSLRVLSLVLSFSLSTLLLLAISLKTLIFLFTYMPMILNFTSPFQALILLLLSHLYHMPLILSTPGSLNRLSVNPNTTEYLLIATQQQRSKLTEYSLSFHGTGTLPV